MTNYTVQIRTTTTTRNGINARPLTTIIHIDADSEIEARRYALASFTVNFPYNGDNNVTYDDIQVNPS